MTGYAGMPGPPVVPFYAGRTLPRSIIKASMQLIFTIASSAGLGSALWHGILRWQLLVFALVMLPMIIAGNRLGARVSGRVSDPAWRTTVGLVLGGAAVAAFVRLV